MSEENKKFIPEGVFLVCDKGEIVTQLLGSPERNVYFYGVKACTEADNKFEINIMPFGSCKNCGTCKFTEIQWIKVKEKGSINNRKALLEHSEGICREGQGCIKIYLSEYEADLANKNSNESPFVKESISSQILGGVLTSPFGSLIELFCKDDDKFTEGVGRGFKKGLEGTWNFFTQDIRKADTWEGMGKMAVIGVAYSSPVTGGLMGDSTLQMLDNQFGTDFKQTKDNLVEGVKKSAGNAWEDVKRGNMGEVGESVGQLEYAIVEALVGSKGAGLAVKGATAGTKALIGAERLTQLSATFAKVLERIRMGSVIKVGKKIEKVVDDLDLSGTKRNSIGQLYDEKTGKYVKDPKTVNFTRSMSERKKALMRDALDPNSGLSDRARKQILDSKGNKVPTGYAVDHKKPLYTKKTIEGKKGLDKAENMQTIRKSKHKKLHSYCNKEKYHKYPPKNYK